MNLDFTSAAQEDVPSLIDVQNRAFYADLQRYGVCPGYGHTPESMGAMVNSENCHVYKILLNGELVGDILVGIKGCGLYRLGGLCVVPEHQGKGIGGQAMAFLDKQYPDAIRWNLETPADKEENHRFYRRHGYRKTGETVEQGVALALFQRAVYADGVEERLAESLTGESTQILPYLPYLLQDFWALGSSPEEMLQLFQAHIPHSPQTRVLDLGCGKGAVSIRLAKTLGVRTKGIDLIPEFIQAAQQKAREHGVEELCQFQAGEISQAAGQERDYDVAILGAVGDVLGDYPATLAALASVVKPGGYILLDDAYLPDDRTHLRGEQPYPTLSAWNALFAGAGLEALGMGTVEDYDYGDELGNIVRRAEELVEMYPEQRPLLDAYVASQRQEYEDLDSSLVGAVWLLQKSPKK